MKMDLEINISQKLMLSQKLQQSLTFLQLPLPELYEHLRELSMSNPLIDFDDIPAGDVSLEHASSVEETRTRMDEYSQVNDNDSERVAISTDIGIPDSYTGIRSAVRDGDDEGSDFTAFFSRPQTLNEYLHEQLGFKKNIEAPYDTLVSYLIDCLSSTGYLDIPLEELSEELSVPLSDLEEALFVLQSFDPAGVGARNLSECLLIQITQSEAESAASVSIDKLILLIMKGLPLLGTHDYKALSKLLQLSYDDTRLACDIVSSLNPIPSRGFYSDSPNAVIIPDAYVSVGEGSIDISINRRALPQVRVDSYYNSLIETGSGDGSADKYLREKLKEASDAIDGIESRVNTLERVLRLVADRQRDFFLHGGGLVPLTRSELAEELSLSNSTISRAVKDKYLQFDGRVLPLDSFFTNAVGVENGQSISAHAIRDQLKRMVDSEDKKRPLSDQAIEERFGAMGINVSRRTIAKYRAQLNIPSTTLRRER